MISGRESIYSDYRFVREWSYLWMDYMTGLQASYAGEIRIQKAGSGGGVWNWVKSLPQKFVGRLKKRPSPVPLPVTRIVAGAPDPASVEEAEQVIFDRLDEDWNKVYREDAYKGSVLGLIAENFIRRGFDLNRLKSMSLTDLDGEMRKEGPGLDELDDWLEKSGWKKSQYFAHLWAQREGAGWLAVYDEHGQRSGRAYDVITKMYRDVLTDAIARDKPLDKLRQALLYADDTAIKDEFVDKDGRLDEDAYQAFIERHLSRDMVRFAVTEAGIAYNNGKLLQVMHEGGEYVRFVGGGMRL